jgi:hypothetical protein
MPSFSLTPLDPFPPAAGPFPGGTQFQDELVNVGPPEPKYVNFTGNGVTATYSPLTGTVNVNIPGGGSGGGGGGTPVMFAKHAVDQKSGDLLIYENATVYATSKGQYDTNTGIFTALVGGLFSFSASSIIRVNYAPGIQLIFYLGIGTYYQSTLKSIIYAASQFNHLYPSNPSLSLGASVSVNLPLSAGEKVAVAVLDLGMSSRINFDNSIFFRAGSEDLNSEGAVRYMPTFSVIYYPLS